jgi:hypothetical protein
MDIPNEPISTRKYKITPETTWWGKKKTYKPAKIANIVEKSAEEKEKRDKAFNYKYGPEAEERDKNIAEQMEMIREGGKTRRSRSKSRSKTRRSKTRRSKTRRSKTRRSKTRRSRSKTRRSKTRR